MPGRDVGIEHTEAVSENVARKQVLRERETSGPRVHFIDRATPGEPRKTSAQLRREILANSPGDGWRGDEPEREWANAVAYFVDKKLPKMVAGDFTRYDVNWLLVYASWPLPAVRYATAVKYLEMMLEKSAAYHSIDAVFVLTGSEIWSFSRYEGACPINVRRG